MPIRLCQKCGLKVLIDESQAGSNPFYCQRCTTAMKGSEGAAASSAPAMASVAAPRNPTPSPVVSRSEAPLAGGAAKPATVRVLCPYCKASFNGRVPTKPARGSCPVCQKELILLPNGDIKPAAGFDLGQWQSGDSGGGAPGAEPAVAAAAEIPKESNTRLLVKKYAAEPMVPAARKVEEPPKPAVVTAPAETDTSDEAAALPSWLDDSGGAPPASPPVKAQPETDLGIDVVEPPKAAAPPESEPEPEPAAEPVDSDIQIQNEPPPPPAPRGRSPVVAKMPTIQSGRPPTAVVPPPPKPMTEVPKTARVPSGQRKAPLVSAPAPVAAGDPGETGGGKVFLAFILAVLPVAVCFGLLSSQDKLEKNDLVKKLGARFTKGFGKLHERMFPPPPPPKPKMEAPPPPPEPPREEPPKPDAKQQHEDEIKISHIYSETLQLQRNLKQIGVAASPEQQKAQDEIKKSLDAKKEQIQKLREMYQKMYGKDYDPAKD